MLMRSAAVGHFIDFSQRLKRLHDVSCTYQAATERQPLSPDQASLFRAMPLDGGYVE